MTTIALVGPLPTVTFNGGPHRERPTVVYTRPRDTCDLRYAFCTDHHVACDCREAEWAEQQNEWRYARDELQTAADTLLAGHRTWQWADDGNTFIGCMCTGCQLARAVGVGPRSNR